MPQSEPPHGGTRSITSLQNDRVKLIRSLEMRKARRETGLFVAEGVSLLVTARDAGWTPRTLVFLTGSAQSGVPRQLIDWARDSGAECLEVSRAVLAKLAAKDNPQIMLAAFDQRWAGPPAPKAVAQDAVWLALENIRDPGNLGTIIRTADAVGAGGIVLLGTCCDPYSREAVRASMGSIFCVPIVGMTSPDFLAWAARWPGGKVGTSLAARHDFRAVTYGAPALLMMGGEGPGLSPELEQACSQLVKIPMAGRLDSLNLAVATALVLYEIRRARLHV